MVNAKVSLSEKPSEQEKICNPNLENKASFISRALFLWTNKVISKGNTQTIKDNDLFDLREQEKLSHVLNAIRDSQQKYKGKSFSYMIYKTCAREFLFSGILSIFVAGLSFAGPIFLNLIIQNIANPFSDQNEGYLYASLLFACFILKAFVQQHSARLNNRITFQAANQILGVMYEKLLKLSNPAKKYMDPGKMTNLVLMNTMEILQFFFFAFLAMTAPLIIIAASIYIIYELSYVGLIAPFMLILSSIFVNHLSSKQANFRRSVFTLIDRRCKQITEFFQGIKIIKYYAWEDWVVKVLEKVRNEEMKLIFGFLFNIGQVECISAVSPSIIAVLVFVIYILIDNQLNAAKAFTVLSLINMLQSPIVQIVSGWSKFTQAKVSYARICHFLEAEEFSPDYYDKELMQNTQNGEITIVNGTFSWESEANEVHNLKNPDSSIFASVKTDQIQQEIEKKKKLKEDVSQLQKTLEDLKNKKTPNAPTIVPNLHSINLNYKPGTFNGIYGVFSSGKSTLAHALINEINKNSGKIAVNGTVAFVPQTPWLRSCSLRENILFGEEYDRKKYQKVLRICQLGDDIKQLPGGDLTEIGERGVNLSGGQKQRISIARAVYSDRDIFVIDDCLSALDSHVGGKIFKKVFEKHLKGKTIVFITHHVHYMKYFDTITILKEGAIADFGTLDQLVEKNSEPLAYLRTNDNHKSEEDLEKIKESDEENINMMDNKNQNEDDLPQEMASLNKIPHQNSHVQKNMSEFQSVMTQELDMSNTTEIQQQEEENQKKGMLTQSEEKAVGSVPFFVYKEYFKMGGYGYIMLALFIFALSQAALMMSDWWLGQWSQNQYDELSNEQYAGIYAGLSISSGFMYIFRYLAFLLFSLQISKNIFRKLLVRLLRGPMEFFDKTPLGRIIARFTKDIDSIDYWLQMILQQLTGGIMNLIASIVMISMITPIFLAIAAILILCYYFILRREIRCSREIKRIVDNIRAPLIGVYTELNQGLVQIRSQSKEQYFFKSFSKCVDQHTRATFNNFYCDYWLNLITDLFSSIIIAASAYLGLAQKSQNAEDYKLAALIGLSLTWALKISFSLPITVRFIAETELQMNSVHRILNYINETPQERDYHINQEQKQAQPEEHWPKTGGLEIINASYKYRKDTPVVLKNISLSIKSNEKIGVIGRTGSGKSTMTLGILRILELADEENGQIVFDGKNIGKLGLHELRSNISMIPQDPILFQGTMRSNVDPFDFYSDQEVANALKKVQLWETLQLKAQTYENKDQVKTNPQSSNPKINTYTVEQIHTESQSLKDEANEKILKSILSLPVESNGSNFSQGEKQLIALSRVIVRKCKLLLMDEATASIDEKTDWIIQNMIRSEFKDTTIITIAHRLKTIIQYDKILVLGEGEIKEFGSPREMLSNQNSYLLKLIRENGKEHENEMRNLAFSPQI